VLGVKPAFEDVDAGNFLAFLPASLKTKSCPTLFKLLALLNIYSYNDAWINIALVAKKQKMFCCFLVIKRCEMAMPIGAKPASRNIGKSLKICNVESNVGWKTTLTLCLLKQKVGLD
jgi:hypothetical protein